MNDINFAKIAASTSTIFTPLYTARVEPETVWTRPQKRSVFSEAKHGGVSGQIGASPNFSMPPTVNWTAGAMTCPVGSATPKTYAPRGQSGPNISAQVAVAVAGAVTMNSLATDGSRRAARNSLLRFHEAHVGEKAYTLEHAVAVADATDLYDTTPRSVAFDMLLQFSMDDPIKGVDPRRDVTTALKIENRLMGYNKSRTSARRSVIRSYHDANLGNESYTTELLQELKGRMDNLGVWGRRGAVAMVKQYVEHALGG